jgi:CelD/BcsL family acetyltransferase involved in cellulose biosynthesis
VFEVVIENFFSFLSNEYFALFMRSRATAFQHPLWLDRLYSKLVGQVGAKPLIIVVRSRTDGSLAMVLPMLRQRRSAMRVVEFADLGVSDYNSPVCDEFTLARIVRDEATCKDIQRALSPYDLLWVRKLREDLSVERLFQAKPRTPMKTSAYAVPLYAPFAQWRTDNIDGSYHKELDVKGRRLRRKGQVRFECPDDPDVISATFRMMRECRRPRFGDDDLLQNPAYFDFYLDVATQGARTGVARTYTMFMDDRPIAGVFGLVHKDDFLVILPAFDLAGFKNLSIGALTFEAIAKDCIEKGQTRLDFTIGDEPYKRLFGATAAPLWATSRSGSPVGSLASFVANQAPWAMTLAKRFV